MMLIDRILQKIDEKKNSCVVGLDPVPERIPSNLFYGSSDESIASAFRIFVFGIIDSIYDLVPIVKPQIAFYEKYGSPGLQAFKDVVEYARMHGLIVIEDGKRADILSTSKAYADGHLGKVWTPEGERHSLNLDLLTINPYLGNDGLDPFIESCRKYDKGVFILVKTSNPSSVQFQDRMVKVNELEENLLRERGISVEGEYTQLYNLVALQVDKYAEEYIGERGYSSLGAVVGAPFPEQVKTLRKIMPRSIFLVPGYGKKQGGRADDVVHCFNDDGYGAVVNSSRDIDFAWETENNKRDWGKASREKTIEMISDIRNIQKKEGKIPMSWSI